jgi:hypothetical protein
LAWGKPAPSSNEGTKGGKDLGGIKKGDPEHQDTFKYKITVVERLGEREGNIAWSFCDLETPPYVIYAFNCTYLSFY